MDTLLILADKHNKKIKGYRNSSSIYGLLVAVQHCRSKLAEQFIVDNKIKLTAKLLERDDWIGDLGECFQEEYSYDLVEK
jgi:hypothetical protein